MVALPYLILWDLAHEPAVTRSIRLGMTSREEDVAWLALHAVVDWSRLALTNEISLPPSIVTNVVSLCDFRRSESLASALKTARKLLEAGNVNKEDKEQLLDVLDLLFDETAYQNHAQGSSNASTLSLVRAECVRLAATLASGKRKAETRCVRWIEAAFEDPLPEVRFALQNE